ncbi:MAG: Thiol-disulfide oxidoreductase ResA [Planctomycetota bacterium]|jgi:thiol-disulfide isomerase/thioredoxin
MKLSVSNLSVALRRMFLASLFATTFAATTPAVVVAQDKEGQENEASAKEESEESDLLTVGSKAPSLDVEHWVQNGKGKFKPVKKFEDGKVYVVEFWATWCGPCIASMPHLSELQTNYADKGVQIVSISDEDLETVETFLKREVNAPAKEEEGDDDDKKEGDKEDKEDEDSDAPKTYADVTAGYCLTTDPDGSSQKDYMQAAQQNGIPTAFIVGKKGVIEWIGHPMEMDEPLAAVVDDKWDRAAFVAEFKAKQEAQLKMSKLFGMLNAGKTKEAMKVIDSLIEEAKQPQEKRQFQMLKLQVLLQGDDKDAAADFSAVVLEDCADDPMMVNQISWAMVQMTEAGQLDNPSVLKAALKVASEAVEKADAESRAAIQDTLAHLHFLTGDIEKAIEVQKQAIEGAGEEMKEELKAYLEKLESEKNKKDK